MHVFIIGLSHKTAPVGMRERLSFTSDETARAVEDLGGLPAVAEAVLLSTCNRTEIYIASAEPEQADRQVIDYLCRRKSIRTDELEEHLYRHHEDAAVRHLFRVICSLDSMVVGEAQILGQVKEAFELALDNESTGIIFNRLFRHAIEVGKSARTDTSIGESAVSVSSAAIELAKRVFGVLAGKTVLIVGAGKMSELTAKYLVSNGVTDVVVANRTYERAVALADKFGGRAVSFEGLIDHLSFADIVISSTGSPHLVIEMEHMSRAMPMRKGRPVFMMDIAVPRDIDPRVNELENVYLYDIDDLQIVVDENVSQRHREAVKVESIIENAVSEHQHWLTTLEVAPVISDLRGLTEEIRMMELDKALRRLGDLDEKEVETVKALSVGIVNKILHEPIVRMKQCANEKDGYVYVEAMRRLFGIDDKSEEG